MKDSKEKLSPMQIAHSWKFRREDQGASPAEMEIINNTINRIADQEQQNNFQSRLGPSSSGPATGSGGNGGPDSFAGRFGGSGNNRDFAR